MNGIEIALCMYFGLSAVLTLGANASKARKGAPHSNLTFFVLLVFSPIIFLWIILIGRK